MLSLRRRIPLLPEDQREPNNRYHDQLRAIPPWNGSVSLCDLRREKRLTLARFDSRARLSKKQPTSYIPPISRASSVSDDMRQKRAVFNEVKEAHVYHVMTENPTLCTQNLEARAFRHFLEASRWDDRLENDQIPFSRPTRRKHSVGSRKVHSGKYETEKRNWSCCGQYGSEAMGCETQNSYERTWCLEP